MHGRAALLSSLYPDLQQTAGVPTGRAHQGGGSSPARCAPGTSTCCAGPAAPQTPCCTPASLPAPRTLALALMQPPDVCLIFQGCPGCLHRLREQRCSHVMWCRGIARQTELLIAATQSACREACMLWAPSLLLQAAGLLKGTIWRL